MSPIRTWYGLGVISTNETAAVPVELFLLLPLLLGLGLIARSGAAALKSSESTEGFRSDRKRPHAHRPTSTGSALDGDPSAPRARPQYRSVSRMERELAAMPPEIRSGRLVLSETTLRRKGARPLFAKVDQVFETRAGLLVPVETKNRLYLTPGDLVQLSAQAAALRSRYGSAVASYGYLRVALAGSTGRYFRYELLDDAVIDRLVDRYHVLRHREGRPIARPGPRKCGGCMFRNACLQQRL